MKHSNSFIFYILTFAFACIQVNAAPANWAALETTAYDEDESDGGNAANYSMFYCSIASAEKLFKGSSVGDIEEYLENNFATAKSMATTYDSTAFSDGEYHILDYVNTAFGSSEYVAFAIYGDDAYRAYGNGSAVLTPAGNLAFNEEYAATGSVGEWTARTEEEDIPEPTSGLLLLIGLAGISLKRKRNKA